MIVLAAVRELWVAEEGSAFGGEGGAIESWAGFFVPGDLSIASGN